MLPHGRVRIDYTGSKVRSTVWDAFLLPFNVLLVLAEDTVGPWLLPVWA